MSLEIESPGLFTTIQDGGRYGHQKEGVVVGGGMDAVSLRIANILIGNDEFSPVIEITQVGPKIRFKATHLIALTGADLRPVLDGEPVKLWRPLLVDRGSLLEFGQPACGRFAYIAVSGGFEIPKILDSYSTYVQAGIGGWEGRPLKKKDVIPCKGSADRALRLIKVLQGAEKNKRQPKWTPAPWLLPACEEHPILRAIKGPEYNLFTQRSRKAFWEGEFEVMPESDRMGYQLKGPVLSLLEPGEILSSAVTFGTVQVPASGNPIVLGADRQTTGGYPRIGQLITADLPKFVQVQPGRIIRFQEVSLDQAQQTYAQQELNMEELKRAVRTKLS